MILVPNIIGLLLFVRMALQKQQAMKKRENESMGFCYRDFTGLSLQLLPDPSYPKASAPKPGLSCLCPFEHTNHQKYKAAIL